jgi:4-hydroxyphenylpyruvate dioxygenase
MLSTVKTYGDTTHTFVQRIDYNGVFLPGFKAHHQKDLINDTFPGPKLEFIDHCVGN